jgi:hypothetical protein
MRLALALIAAAALISWLSIDSDIKAACGSNQACLAASL